MSSQMAMMRVGQKSAAVRSCRLARCSSRQVRARAVPGFYNHTAPDPDFIDAVIDAFPEAAVANPEEARVLYSHDNYVWLDIRNKIDVNKYGMVQRAVNVPFYHATKRFVDGQMEVDEDYNEDWLPEIEARFPDKETKILVADINGNDCAIDALGMLEDAGYTNIVGIRGGYRAWFKTWDNKLARRNLGEFVEDPYAAGGDSCGIHASGAGFQNIDAQSSDFWNTF